MTEKQLISKLRELKQVKPRKDWVLLVKNEILKKEAVINQPAQADFAGLFSSTCKAVFQSKMAYSFATLLFIFAGAFGFVQYNTISKDTLLLAENTAEQFQAALMAETSVKSTFETLKKKSNDLATVKTQKDGNVSFATKELNDVAKSLTDAIVKDPSLAKKVAMGIASDQTLMAVFSVDDLKESSDDLLRTLDDQMIEDIQKSKATFTKERQDAVEEVLELYNEKKYAQAFEELLLIGDWN